MRPDAQSVSFMQPPESSGDAHAVDRTTAPTAKIPMLMAPRICPRAKVGRTKEAAPSLLVDYDDAGHALGLEILVFDDATVTRINEVLVSIGHAALADQQLAPLRAA